MLTFPNGQPTTGADADGRTLAAAVPIAEPRRVSPVAARSRCGEHGHLGETAARQRGEWGQPNPDIGSV